MEMVTHHQPDSEPIADPYPRATKQHPDSWGRWLETHRTITGLHVQGRVRERCYCNAKQNSIKRLTYIMHQYSIDDAGEFYAKTIADKCIPPHPSRTGRGNPRLYPLES